MKRQLLECATDPKTPIRGLASKSVLPLFILALTLLPYAPADASGVKFSAGGRYVYFFTQPVERHVTKREGFAAGAALEYEFDASSSLGLEFLYASRQDFIRFDEDFGDIGNQDITTTIDYYLVGLVYRHHFVTVSDILVP